jgi:hypothetical protein
MNRIVMLRSGFQFAGWPFPSPGLRLHKYDERGFAAPT